MRCDTESEWFSWWKRALRVVCAATAPGKARHAAGPFLHTAGHQTTPALVAAYQTVIAVLPGEDQTATDAFGSSGSSANPSAAAAMNTQDACLGSWYPGQWRRRLRAPANTTSQTTIRG
uniref:Uncharacterized protein n=1 Tax=Phytophthora fragariae TaxID=53985 RepID=A0A6A3EW16_9STRA|nr:hypothetical protein PF009_g13561 [Phytophthora fragariae]